MLSMTVQALSSLRAELTGIAGEYEQRVEQDTARTAAQRDKDARPSR
jgi:hypothetical protein